MKKWLDEKAIREEAPPEAVAEAKSESKPDDDYKGAEKKVGRCPRCGRENPIDSTMCIRCGCTLKKGAN